MAFAKWIVALTSALAITLAAATGAQAASTVSVVPATPNAMNDFPFGTGQFWPPNMGFVYKNVPAFELKADDTISFDLSQINDNDDQLAIALAATTVNGGDIPTGPFTPIVSSTQTPANPRGNTTTGDFELRYRVEAPYSFPGGGLIIRFSDPGPGLAADMTSAGGLLRNGGASTDASGFFVKRFWGDPDGLAPWTGSGDPSDIAAFRLEIGDPPVIVPPKKKCKKAKKKKGKSGAAVAKKKKKKCKKKGKKKK